MTEEQSGQKNESADEALAADFVLGALGRAEHEKAALRHKTDPAFAKLVDAWVARLAALPEPVEPITPSAGVWERISSQVGKRKC